MTADPHGIPVGIAGSAEAVEQVEQQIDEQADGALELVRFDDREAAVEAIELREVYGAIVLPSAESPTPEVLVASAANTAVAQMLQQIASPLQAEVTDVVPYSDDDPNGTGLSVASLPLVMGGMIGAFIISTAIHGTRRRIVGMAVYTVVAGLALTGILEAWFGALQGNFFLNSLAITLSIGAITATIVGLRSLLGNAGLVIGAVLMFFIANPISGAALPPEFLVGAWGQIGQWFPPGAGQTLIRTLSYFPSADMSMQWWVLASWTAFGVVLLLLAALMKPRSAADEAESEVARG